MFNVINIFAVYLPYARTVAQVRLRNAMRALHKKRALQRKKHGELNLAVTY